MLFIGAFIGTVGSIYAQKVGEIQSIKEQSGVPKSLTTPMPGSSGAETIIWSEDFSTGIPSTWLNYGTANGTSDPDAKWEYRGPNTTPSNTVGSRGAYLSAQTPIASATASNGFVIFDSDYLDNGGIAGNFGNGIAAAPHVAELITSTINLTGSTSIILNFTQYYRRFAGPGGSQAVPATYVDFSINGGSTWSNTVALNSTLAVNSFTATNSSISIPIGSYVGGQANVKIRFRFDGDYYFWIIDDISITGQQANSIASFPNFTGEAFDVEFNGGVKQGHLSTSQAQSINFKGSLWNNGTAAQTGAKLSVSIFKDGIYQTDVTGIQQSLPAGDSAIITTQSWTPTAPGNYEWIYSISTDSVPAFLISDTIAFAFGSIQSMDFGSWDNSIGASTNSSQWGDGSAVCQKLKILNNDTLLGVEIGLSSLTQPGSIIELAVYDSAGYLGNNGGWNSSLLRAYKQVVISTTDTANGFVYVDVTNPTNGIGVGLNTGAAAYFLNVTMYNNQGANYIALRNDQTFLKSPNSGYMYLAALGSWYSGYSGSKSFNNIWLRANLSGGQASPPPTTGCDEFFISEYIEGSSNNKALEIYNPTSSLKSIGGYSITLFSNGAVTSTNTFTFPAGTYLQPFGTYVIGHGSAVSGIISLSDTTYPYPNVVSYNGDDAVVLFTPTGDTLDIIGIVGVDPGSNWAVGSGATNEHTLVRKANVNSGQLDWSIGATEWDIYPQNTFTQLGAHTSTCYMCDVNETLTIPNEVSCGGSPVTFSATPLTSGADVIWMNANSQVIHSGNTFTTPIITQNTNYFTAVYLDNTAQVPAQMGPPSTLTGGFGNFTNGMWFSVQNPMTLDSITVISNGMVNFQVRISEGGGNKITGHNGNELQRSDTITVGASGTHKVPVGIHLMPGTYYMNMAFLGGSSGQLFRSTSGANYPYSINGIVSLDSVQFGGTGTNPRVYYAFEWVVSEGCVGPVSTATAIAGAAPSTSFPYQVDFNNGIPCNWTTDGTTQDWSPVSSYGSSTIDGTAFVIFDDDAAGSSAAPVNVSLISPEIDAMGYDTITLEFDHYWRSYTGTTGYVEVWDGSNWNTIDNLTTTRGSWSSPVHETYNITAYQNANLKVRLRYSDGSGTWGWYWAVDNIKIDGTLSPCTPVRVEVITDIYGSEVSWYIKDINTGITWLSGGPYADVSPYNISAATHIDTICLPNSGTYEFRINDSYGDGMDDGTNAGWFSVDVLCPSGPNRIIQIDTSLVGGNGASWGSFLYGNTTNPPMYDSAVFTVSTCGSIVVYDRISDFTTVDSNGVADSLNAYAHFTGTVFTDDFDNNSGYSFYLHDGSGGINVFKSVDVLGYGTPNRGDSIEIFGSIIQYYGLTEIVPDSIYLLKQAASLPAVSIINALGEEQESELVRLNGVHLVNPSQWTNAGSGFNVDVTDGTTNNVVRIRSGSSLYGKPAPTGIFDVIGAGSQFDVSNPYTSGYQMWPRDTNDIIPRPVQITFQVDLSNQPVNQTKGVHIAGTFNGWQPNITQMFDLDGDGIYSVAIGLVAGDTTVQYKFINGNSWSDPHDQVSGNCSVNALGDRWLSVPWMDDTIPAVHLSSCTILSPIDVLTDNQPLICSGDTIILDATNTVWNVVWSTGDTTQSIAVTQPGKYWFSANYYAGTPGISVFDTTSVAFHEPTQVIAGSDLDICNGDSVLLSASYPIVVATIDSSFSVQSPVNIAGNYLNTIPTISSSGWGTLTYTSITDTIVLMNDGASGINTAYGYQFPESLCGCDSLGVVSNADLAGKIVLISRGSCEFGRKAYYAQLAGASGVIIYNALPDSASGGGTISMAPAAVGSLVTIPTTFVANGTGLLIKSNLNQVGTNYTWSNGVVNGSYFKPTSSVSLTVIGYDINGCVSYDTLNINVKAAADTSVTASGNLSFCSGSSVTLSAASGQSYLWNTGDTSQTLLTSQSGFYYAVVTTSNGCSDTTATYTTTLLADPDTTVTASQTLFCASESATISAAGGYDYLWNTGDTTQSINVNTAGGYYVTLTSSYGCSASSDTTMITVVPDIVLPQISSNGLGWVITGSITNFSVPLDTNYSYQWGVTGGTIQFGQGSNGIAVQWGIPDSNVAVWVVISNGVCSDSVGISINISGIGTDENALQDVRLFPNPNDGYFTIEVGEAFIGASYEIVDGMGRQIARGEIQSLTQDFDLADKPKGVYKITLTGKSASNTMVVVLQ